MKTVEKLAERQERLGGASPVTIAFLGDSVTQGCFENYIVRENCVDTVFKPQYSYVTQVEKILRFLYPRAQVSVINAGVSGNAAIDGYARLERDVLRFNPDLTVVSFGLNDACDTVHADALESYLKHLGLIFDKLQAAGSEVVFLTQNYMATGVSHRLTNETLREWAKNFAEIQTSGRLKHFFECAKTLCAERGIPVADIYESWEYLEKAGTDVTGMLSNYLNHPVRELHQYTAVKVIETILKA